MIPNEEKEGWHYLTVKKLSTLLRGMTSWWCYCLWIILILLEQKLNLNLMKKYCKSKDICGILIPSEKGNILEFNQYMKSDKVRNIIYIDIESLIRK